jgi:LysR family hydrogen peroxide-inducible transcriptional activator
LGRLIQPYLAEAKRHAGAAKLVAESFVKLERANLALGVMCTVAPSQFITFLGRFRADTPGIAITLVDDVPDRLCELLTKGELDGEFYFSRINCEFQDVLGDICRMRGVRLIKSYESEREDWILTMVAAGLGVCFLPEFTAAFPGVIGCPVVSPSVARSVYLVSVAGRRQSPPVKTFIRAVRHYPWSAGGIVD